ncbi:MAG: NADH-quinone oxidoreductase subunit C [Lachnospiraceae bacterium]|nr:NADH-quinone oxidoreductase subunit C [Lachnospiraceae bacterium]
MAQVIHPEEIMETIEIGSLLPCVMALKRQHYRLSQACAAYVDERYELSYSFANDETYQFLTLRLVIDIDTEVPSITEIIPAAIFYENEMKEIFGVKIQMISLDYNNKLYRINEVTPLGPKAAAEMEEEA